LNAVTVANTDVKLPAGAIETMQTELYEGEEVLWTGTPSDRLYLLDMLYKGFMWWGMFAFIVPIVPGDYSTLLTGALVFLLTYLEIKQKWHSRAYFITNLRVIYAERTRKGEWKFTDYQRQQFQSSKRAAVMKGLTMKFKTSNGVKSLRFPYLATTGNALNLLNDGKNPELASASTK
jgi:hypothetical protein